MVQIMDKGRVFEGTSGTRFRWHADPWNREDVRVVTSNRQMSSIDLRKHAKQVARVVIHILYLFVLSTY